MSKKYDKVKKYFEDGLWNEERVANAVLKGWITIEEFREITGAHSQHPSIFGTSSVSDDRTHSKTSSRRRFAACGERR